MCARARRRIPDASHQSAARAPRRGGPAPRNAADSARRWLLAILPCPASRTAPHGRKVRRTITPPADAASPHWTAGARHHARAPAAATPDAPQQEPHSPRATNRPVVETGGDRQHATRWSGEPARHPPSDRHPRPAVSRACRSPRALGRLRRRRHRSRPSTPRRAPARCCLHRRSPRSDLRLPT